VPPPFLILTMNCPLCGTMMVWLNGSISHDPPVKYYICRICNIYVTKQADNSYEFAKIKDEKKAVANLRK
jgi:endogenous inhibitor of DNA gyrase (YacG/DUF329 family)